MLREDRIDRITESTDYNLYCEGALADPYGLLRELRDQGPIHWSQRLNAWLLMRYGDVLKGLQDPRLGADRMAIQAGALGTEQRERVRLLIEHVSNWLGFTDPPKHTRLRKLVSDEFTPDLADSVRPSIQHIVDDLLDRAAARAPVIDLMKDFASPLPSSVIQEILGIPPTRRGEFHALVDEIVPFVGGVGPSLTVVADSANEAANRLTTLFRELTRSRPAGGRSSLLSTLWTMQQDGHLSEQELLGMSVFIFAAGFATTVSLLGNGLMLLLTHQDELEKLRSDWNLLPTAVEEILRYESPNPFLTRLALGGFEIEGRTIHKGDAVMLHMAAANRDPDIFSNPDQFDITRKPNRHLAFGWGRHFCLGAPLVRIEAEVAIKTLLQRYPSVQLHRSELTWVKNMSNRCLASIPATIGT